MAASSNSRPSWQEDACPAWCVIEHGEHDLPDDRIHDSAGTYVPVVLGVRSPSESSAAELLVVLSRRCGELDDWLFVGEPERHGQHLLLSRDSGVRVMAALTTLLAD